MLYRRLLGIYTNGEKASAWRSPKGLELRTPEDLAAEIELLIKDRPEVVNLLHQMQRAEKRVRDYYQELANRTQAERRD